MHTKLLGCTADATNADTFGRRQTGRLGSSLPEATSHVALATYPKAAPSWLPTFFDLEDVFSGVRRAVARVWSKHHQIGVRFLRDRS
jgi:hypothetical protein